MTEWLLLGVSLLLVAACGLFVAAEFAFVTVDRSQVDRAADSGDAGAEGVQKALRSLSTQLSGAQVGITVTNLAIGFLAEPAIARLIDGPLEATGLPEGAVRPVAISIALAAQHRADDALRRAGAEELRHRPADGDRARHPAASSAGSPPPTGWLIRLLNGSANALVRRLGVEPQEELRSARSSAELASLVQRSADQGTLDVETAELMERSVEFGTRTAGEIMTPRVRTLTLEAGDRAAAVIELTRQSGHSRFPVLDAEDNVVGTVHVKHAVALPVPERATTRIKHIMVKPIVVPDSIRLDPLMALLRQDGFQMAVVLDEYGGHAGIVTLEDVVEEIVGDISDEHDRLGSRARQRRDGSWILSGLLRPDEVEDVTGIELPEDEDYDTIAGLVLQVLGRVPRPATWPRCRCPTAATPRSRASSSRALTVLHMDGLRIDRLALRLHQGEQTGASGPRSGMSAAVAARPRVAAPGRQRLLRRRRVRADLGPAHPDRAAGRRPGPGWRAPPCGRWRTSAWSWPAPSSASPSARWGSVPSGSPRSRT